MYRRRYAESKNQTSEELHVDHSDTRNPSSIQEPDPPHPPPLPEHLSPSPTIHNTTMHLPPMLPKLILPMERSSSSHTALTQRLVAPILGFLLRMCSGIVSLELCEPAIGTSAGRILAHDVAV
jgi:hypothetical protein